MNTKKGPTEDQIQRVAGQLKKELESPDMAAALRGPSWNPDISLKEAIQRSIILLKQWRAREALPSGENSSYKLFRMHAIQAEVYAQRALKELYALNPEWPAPDSIYFEE